MIRLRDTKLPRNTAKELEGFQSVVNSQPTYHQQVLIAQTLFALRNNVKNSTFKVVRAKLDEMCCGPRRCCYCEDSYADEVEHIRPKNLYPELTFDWENYLYACGPCNGPKRNNFKVFRHATGAVVDVTRKKGDPVVAPLAGDPLLINPRVEDPLEHIFLDLVNTFYFVPVDKQGTANYARAEFTIELLHLNDRDALVLARQNAFRTYRARLYEYKQKKEAGATSAALASLIENLQRLDHPTVWAEMKRQHKVLPEINELFMAVPEAVTW